MFETSDVVVSKALAAEWACNVIPAWRPYIELTRKSYAGQGTAPEREIMLADLETLLELAQAHIQASIQARQGLGVVEALPHA